MGRRKEENEKIWDTQTDRTIYQWSEPSKTKKGTLVTKTSVWTHTVRNECVKKQVKYKYSEPLKEEWRNGVRNTSNGKNLSPFPRRGVTS